MQVYIVERRNSRKLFEIGTILKRFAPNGSRRWWKRRLGRENTSTKLSDPPPVPICRAPFREEKGIHMVSTKCTTHTVSIITLLASPAGRSCSVAHQPQETVPNVRSHWAARAQTRNDTQAILHTRPKPGRGGRNRTQNTTR